MMKSKVYKNLIKPIKVLLLTSEGWLVGGAVKDILEDKEPRDYDIIVPSREKFQIVCPGLANSAKSFKINTFGGMKFEFEDFEIDIWCEELDHFISTANKFEFAFNLKRNVLINKI